MLHQVGLAGLNIIGTAVSGGTGARQQQFPPAEHSVLSEYDDLSFLMYTDTEVAQLVNKLERKKFEAVGTERFEYAKKIKAAIGKYVKSAQKRIKLSPLFYVAAELCEAGLVLGSLEMEKQLLADRQMYDEAKEKRSQMDEFRVEVYKTLEITDLLELQGAPRNN